jgi:hypothetical protein
MDGRGGNPLQHGETSDAVPLGDGRGPYRGQWRRALPQIADPKAVSGPIVGENSGSNEESAHSLTSYCNVPPDGDGALRPRAGYSRAIGQEGDLAAAGGP